MNNPNTVLKDLIHIEKNIIPKNICQKTIKSIENRKWETHTWSDGFTKPYSFSTKELSVQMITPELEIILNPFVIKSILSYGKKYGFNYEKPKDITSQFSSIRFNKYEKNQIMRIHHDHIHSLFDGTAKGIPVLSVIINFNENYKGADLIFWEDYKVNLNEGDIVIFPSLFLFPHQVTEPIEGVRYSGVCWAW